MGVRVVNATPQPLYPRKRAGTHCIVGCVVSPGEIWTSAENLPPPPPRQWDLIPILSSP